MNIHRPLGLGGRQIFRATIQPPDEGQLHQPRHGSGSECGKQIDLKLFAFGGWGIGFAQAHGRNSKDRLGLKV